jgi:hypothetical protein
VVLRYIKKDKAYVYKDSTGRTNHRLLIYGDAVDATSTKKDGTSEEKYGFSIMS